MPPWWDWTVMLTIAARLAVLAAVLALARPIAGREGWRWRPPPDPDA